MTSKIYLTNLKQLFRKPEFYFFTIFLIIGLFVYDDYGLSWDEPISRVNNGILNYDYISKGDYKSLLEGNEKYHGPAFEIFLVYVEKYLNQTDSRAIYLTRHLITFLIFYLAVIFFYRICLMFFKKRWMGLAGCIFLVLSPRIFAESFYNSKDIVFLAFFVISIYTMLLYFEKKNFLAAFLHALVTAILIDIRVIGIIIPAATFFMSCLRFFRSEAGQAKRMKILLSLFFYLATTILFVIICWPVLWHNPTHHFVAAFSEMKQFHWYGNLLLWSKAISASDAPWHYIPSWILVTTPFLYSALFLIGLIIVIVRILREGFAGIMNSEFYLLHLFCIFGPLVSVILFRSVVYDSWRHLYFIYPSFIIISLAGLEKILELTRAKIFLHLSVYAFLICALMQTAYSMFRMHPFQNIYFNFIAGHDLSVVKKRFDCDYWGLSYRRLLETILEKDTARTLAIYTENPPGRTNSFLLPPNERQRLVYVDYLDEANYFITNYRDVPDSTIKRNATFSVQVEGAIIAAAYKLHRYPLPDINKPGERMFKKYFKNNFDSVQTNWYVAEAVDSSVVKPHSGNRCLVLNERIEYSGTIEIKNDTDIINHRWQPYYIKMSLWMNAVKSNSKFFLVVDIHDKDKQSIKYSTLNFSSQMVNQWEKREFSLRIPAGLSRSDIISIYLWNNELLKTYIDDFEIEVISAPAEHSIIHANQFKYFFGQ